jgi:hypothetical protein
MQNGDFHVEGFLDHRLEATRRLSGYSSTGMPTSTRRAESTQLLYRRHRMKATRRPSSYYKAGVLGIPNIFKGLCWRVLFS